MRVSESCLGQMLADRFLMYKTALAKKPEIAAGTKTAAINWAGFRSTVRSNVGKGVGKLVEHSAQLAPALVIAGGIHLLTEALKSAQNKKLHDQADRVFADLRRTSEYVQNDPVLAAEAFDTLKSFAPSMAVKPIVARSFVENVVKGSGQIPIDTANLLAKTESLVSETGRSGGFLQGVKGPLSLLQSGMGIDSTQPQRLVDSGRPHTPRGERTEFDRMTLTPRTVKVRRSGSKERVELDPVTLLPKKGY